MSQSGLVARLAGGGAQVRVRLTTGDELVGQVEEAGDGYVVIRTRDGRSSVSDALLGGFDVLDAGPARDIPLAPAPPPATTNGHGSTSAATGNGSAPVLAATPWTRPARDFDVLRRITQVEARFDEVLKRAPLEPQSPLLALPDGAAQGLSQTQARALHQAWNQMHDRYEYARKVNEPARHHSILRGLLDARRRLPPIGALEYNIGWFADSAGHRVAVEHLIRAGRLGLLPAYLHLAAREASAKRYVGAQWALERLFVADSRVARSRAAWNAFVQFTFGLRNLAPLVAVARGATDLGEEDRELLTDTVLYFVQRAHARDLDRSYAPIAELLASARDSSELVRSLSKPAEILRAKGERAEAIRTRRAELDRRFEHARQPETEVDRLVREAAEERSRGNVATARRLVVEALADDPDHTRAKQLEGKLAPRPRRRSTVPRGQSPYARAKQAEHEERDLVAQERHLRQAIGTGDHLESAVKDLAMLLGRTNRVAEAIELLDLHSASMLDRRAFSNVRAELLTRAERLSDAKEELEKVLRLELPVRRPAVKHRIAAVLIKAQRFDEAETLLREVLETPYSRQATKLLEMLNVARQTGAYDEVDALIAEIGNAAQQAGGLSPLLEFHLDNCTYAGVDAAVVATRSFNRHHVNVLERRTRDLGVRRPRERASYNLSAARILHDSDDDQTEGTRDHYLRWFSAAMGDAVVAESKDRDVARAYYAETIALSDEWDSLVAVKLAQFVMSYYAKPTELLRDKNVPAVDGCLLAVKEKPDRVQAIVEGLVQIASLNTSVNEALVKALSRHPIVRGLVVDACRRYLGDEKDPVHDERTLLRLWDRSINNLLESAAGLYEEFRYLRERAGDLGSIERQLEAVTDLEERARLTKGDRRRLVLSPIELKRLRKLSELLRVIADYVDQQSYLERERLANMIDGSLSDLGNDIEALPTRLSFESIRPYVAALRTATADHFTEYQSATLPTELDAQLAIESYVPDDNGNVKVEVTVANRANRSPASRVRITIAKAVDYDTPAPEIHVSESLPGGGTCPVSIPLSVSHSARREKVFTLRFSLSFRTRTGTDVVLADRTLPISLYDPSEFEPIANPYSRWAHGGPVDEKEMFYGRDDMLQALVDALQTGSRRSAMIYGQRRAGKSTVMLHLQRALKPPLIPVGFSMALGAEMTTSDILFMVCNKIHSAIGDPQLGGLNGDRPALPSRAEVRANPYLTYDYLEAVQTALQKSQATPDARIVLLVDEFTKVYGAIKRGELSSSFMSKWKALLEHGYFTCVLVGQDVMQQFIEDFPNDFQVITPKRISYFDRSSAEALITQPTRIAETGETRFRGTAVERIFELTAGSPYYIQIFCDRLIAHMNDKRAIWVADGHVEEVLDDLIRGPESLTPDKFDNLVFPGEQELLSFPREDTLAILTECARQTRTQSEVEHLALLSVETSCNVGDLLEDLVRREVLERRGQRYRIRVGLLREWLLVNQVGV